MRYSSALIALTGTVLLMLGPHALDASAALQPTSSRQVDAAVLDLFPQALSSRAFQRLARSVASWETTRSPKGGMQFYWQRLVTQA